MPRDAVPSLALVLLAGCAHAPGAGELRWERPDALTMAADRHLVADLAPRAADGALHVLVEIPAGTCDKWEVDEDGVLRWELAGGEPRVVRYLPYPGNYGMVPGTLVAAEDGGDGDPLDVLVLGPAAERGALLRVRPLGVLRLLDGGETDDKLVAVEEGTPLAAAADLADLDARFPGVTAIVETWFTRYKGPGATEARGWGDRAEAERAVERAVQARRAASARGGR